MSEIFEAAAQSDRQSSWNRVGPRVAAVSSAVAVLAIALLVSGLAASYPLTVGWIPLAVWIGLVAFVDLSAVLLRAASPQFSVSLPLLLAAAMVMSPAEAGLVAVLGYVDRREFRGQLPFFRALFNRSQICLSVMASSMAFHALSGDVNDWPRVVPVALVALLVDGLVNGAFVTWINALLGRSSVSETVRGLVPEEGVREFVGAYLCLGFTGLVVGLSFQVGGIMGLLISFSPLFFAAKMLEHSQRLNEARETLRRKDDSLVAATRRMADERRDERQVLAGSLHDDVLPPIYQVHLLGEVVRRDLESGALLELDGDLPALLEATERAADSIRDLIGGLRKSQLGPGGMEPTIQLLVRDLEGQSEARIDVDIERVPGNPLVELVAYQVCREAMVNAVRHSQAGQVRVEVGQESPEARFHVRIQDDGVGFDTSAGKPEGHFGLVLMRERVEALGGTFNVTSVLGEGTRVEALLPELPPGPMTQT